MREREAWLRAFHARHPGITSRAFGRGGTYERLAAHAHGEVLDLACGSRPMPGAIGLDMSLDELAGCDRVAQGRAQEMPFADASFDVVVCHLAFMLFDDIESVVRELTRVVRPGGKFVAVLGGGPTADGHDAFHAFARLLPPGISFGDRRASSETGWGQLFGDRWRGPIEFERHLIDMSGTFDEVWRFLAASYQAPRRDVGDELRAQFPGERVPLAVVTYLATITR
jgi:SAM-dependent methyltransferase